MTDEQISKDLEMLYVNGNISEIEECSSNKEFDKIYEPPPNEHQEQLSDH